MNNNYNRVVFIYDILSQILGKPYRKSKFAFLDRIQSGDQVLYLGGGTGVNLPFILEKVGDTGKVFYFEASSRMIEKAKKRVPPKISSRIVYLHQSDFNKIHREKYDLVLTQYILDILEDREIHALFYAINQRTDGDSKWIFLDFFRVKGKKILLDVMILFFRFLTQNPRKDLPDYGQFFLQYNWGIEEKLSLKKGFIQAWVLGRREIGTEELRDGERKGRRDLETKGLRNGETKGRRD